MSDEPTPDGPPPPAEPTTDEPAPAAPSASDTPATDEPPIVEPVTVPATTPPPRSIARDLTARGRRVRGGLHPARWSPVAGGAVGRWRRHEGITTIVRPRGGPPVAGLGGTVVRVCALERWQPRAGVGGTVRRPGARRRRRHRRLWSRRRLGHGKPARWHRRHCLHGRRQRLSRRHARAVQHVLRQHLG